MKQFYLKKKEAKKILEAIAGLIHIGYVDDVNGIIFNSTRCQKKQNRIEKWRVDEYLHHPINNECCSHYTARQYFLDSKCLPGSVYFLRYADLVKIGMVKNNGHSADPIKARVRAVSKDYGIPFRLSYVIDVSCCFGFEHHAHTVFENERITRELFRWSDGAFNDLLEIGAYNWLPLRHHNIDTGRSHWTTPEYRPKLLLNSSPEAEAIYPQVLRRKAKALLEAIDEFNRYESI